MLCQKIDFALVKSQLRENSPVVEVVLGIELSIDESHHMIAARIRNSGEFELVQVAPVNVVTGIVKVLGAHIGVETVGERIMDGAHVPACCSTGLEHNYFMAA